MRERDKGLKGILNQNEQTWQAYIKIALGKFDSRI